MVIGVCLTLVGVLTTGVVWFVATAPYIDSTT